MVLLTATATSVVAAQLQAFTNNFSYIKQQTCSLIFSFTFTQQNHGFYPATVTHSTMINDALRFNYMCRLHSTDFYT